MMYQFVWTHRDAQRTEESIPMVWHGQHLRRMGWSNPIVLVFLEGLPLLSKGYQQRLERLGYEILDCHGLAADIVHNVHPKLRGLPPTDKYWFLRWSVLGALLERNGIRCQAIQVDGDVVFTSDPIEVERDVAGKTFVLQGNPHFTVIDHPRWFDMWRKELNLFLDNKAEYIRIALREKVNPTLAPREFCNVCAYGPNRFQDQDLIEYLIAAGKLPQAPTDEVFNSRFYWVQNPLLPGEWFEEQTRGEQRSLVEEGFQSLVGRKPLAYLHFQAGFVRYANLWFANQRKGTQNSIDTVNFIGKMRQVSRIRSLIRYLAVSLLGLRRMISRRSTYEACFTRNPATGNHYVTDIVNSCWGSL